MNSTNILRMFLFVFLATSAFHSYGIAEWDVTTVTANSSLLAHDYRRPMGAGLYDATAEKTFICFTGDGMVPLVAAYDHASGTWGAPIAVGIPDTSTDAHDYSHIFMSADGHIHLTYSRHNLSLWIATSENPHSIAGTWNVREIGSGLKATYPMPLTGSDGTLYILYRVTLVPTDYRPIKWVKSTDNGATWSAPVSCIDYNNSRTDNMNEIYLGQMNHEPAHPSFGEGYSASWTLAGGGPSAHDHDDYHKNMYYAFFSMSNAHWLAADGTDLGVNIDDYDAETYCKVYDSGALVGNRELGEIQDIGYTSAAACDANGNPVVAFQNGKDNSIDIGLWDGIGWNVSTPPTFEGTRSLRDMKCIDGKVWLLEDDGTGDRVVELNGTSWTDFAAFHPELNTGESIFIDNAQSEVMIFTALDTEAIYSVGYAAGPDRDLDGLLDQWEWDYFGSLSVSSGLPSDDQDGDGFSDLSEYFAGTVPTNAASLLKVSIARSGLAPSDTVLSWQSVSGKVYFVESTANLLSGSWTTDPLPIGGTPPFCTYTTQVDNVTTFFRIKLEH